MGHFEYLEDSVQGKAFRVYTPVGKLNSGKMAMELAKGALVFFVEYFGVPYPMDILDLVPLPESNYRALEGWGCITFVSYVLLNDENTDIKERKLNSRTICHEISHMWFGNLVTMEWWNDIWLNEGFARYNEFKCLNSCNKDFEIWDAYIDLIYFTALNLDSTEKTHAIQVECKAPRDLHEIFDTIAYAKGASVLRMLDKHMGYQPFKEGIIEYLKKYSFQNTTTEDLFNVLTIKNNNDDINSFMKTWLTVPGFPVVYASIRDKRYLELEQKSIQSVISLTKNKQLKINNSECIWQIPLFLKTSKGVTNKYIMKEKKMTIDLVSEFNFTEDDFINRKDFIKINNDISGFYSVIYDDNLLSLLMNIPKEGSKDSITSLTNYDKIGMFFDYYIQQRYSDLFKILNGIKPIDSNIILKHALKLYNTIRNSIFTVAHLQDTFKDKYNHYSDNLSLLVDKIKNFFSELVHYDEKTQQSIEEELSNKIFNTSKYEKYSELNDEFLDICLHYQCIISSNKNLISFICNNYIFGKVNTNFKYTVYAVILANAHNYWDEKKFNNFYMEVVNEYITTYYSISYTSRHKFKLCLAIMENLSEATIENYAVDIFNLNNEKFDSFTTIFKENPTCIKKYLNILKKLKDNEKNVIVLSEITSSLESCLVDSRYQSLIEEECCLKLKSFHYDESLSGFIQDISNSLK